MSAPAAKPSVLPSDGPIADVVIDIVSDVVCPWCYVGKRKLEAALAQLENSALGIAIARRWHPFQLNPDMPAAGIPRADYVEAKFGGKARAIEVNARVRSAGAEVGIAFDFDRIARQPNTLDAHRLIAWGQQQGDVAAVDTLVEMIFRGFFVEGRRLDDRDELARIAGGAGFDTDAAGRFLASNALRAEVESEDREARESGISGVPFFIFNGRTAVSGAHDPSTLLEAIAAAREGG
ncbi:MAG: DsbA family oxidoreductase [Betaproteobacteria bacterium]